MPQVTAASASLRKFSRRRCATAIESPPPRASNSRRKTRLAAVALYSRYDQAAVAIMQRTGSRNGCPSLDRAQVRSALLEAVGLVAGTAIVLANIADGGLEAVEVRHRSIGGLGVFTELLEARFEVGHVVPDLGKGFGVTAGLGIVREQARHFPGRVLECRKHLVCRGEIE